MRMLRSRRKETEQEMPSRLLCGLTVTIFVQLTLGSLFLQERSLTETKEVCSSDDCLTIAMNMLMAMNQTMDPCEDFYNYACSSSESYLFGPLKTILSEAQTMATKLGQPLRSTEAKNATEKAMMAFEVCAQNLLSEEEEFKTVQTLLEEEGYGDWPLLKTDRKKLEKFQTIEDVFLLVGLDEFFNITVRRDIEGGQSGIIWFLPEMHEYSQASGGMHGIGHDVSSWISYYRKAYEPTKDEFGPIASNEVVNTIEQTCQVFMDTLEQKIKHTVGGDDMWVITIRELETRIPRISFLKLINNILKNVNVTLTYDDRVVIVNPLMHQVKVKYLLDTDPHDIFNCLGISRAKHLLSFTSKWRRNAADKAYKAFPESAALIHWQREIDCVFYVRQLAPAVVARLHVQNSPGIRERQIQGRLLANLIGKEYNRRLQFTPWLDRQTRQRALKKLRKMRPCVGFSNTILNDTLLEAMYENVKDIRRNYSLPQIIARFERNNKQWFFRFLQKGVKYVPLPYPFDKNNGFYSVEENEIVVPDGLLGRDFAKSSLPMYFSLAAVGKAVGHGIIHGFDNTGRKFDERGNFADWWSNYTREQFDEKASCFVEQYGKIVDAVTNMTLDGKRTLGENIADNGGIRTAYHAYRTLSINKNEIIPVGLNNFTTDQLFFIAFAVNWCLPHTPEITEFMIKNDVHSPFRYRVNVPLQNMEEFSAAFNCKKGSRMRLTDRERCVLW